MIRRLIRGLLGRMPAPMAAPETPDQRRRRLQVIVLLALLGLVTLLAATLNRFSRLGTAVLWLTLVGMTLYQAMRWLAIKLAADAAWLDQLREQGREP
jgi:hypothetical protein